MGTAIFTWKTRYGEFTDGFLSRTDRDESSSGIDRARSLGPSRFVVPSLTVIFTDGTAGESLKDFDTFWRTTLAEGTDSFLFKSHTPAFFKIEAEAGGTASGGGGETFTTVRKFLDTSTLVVKVNGTTQTVTTDYSVSLNYTTPMITTTASFDTGTVTLDYEFYYQVRATTNGYGTEFLNRGSSLTDTGAQTMDLSVREWKPGGSLA